MRWLHASVHRGLNSTVQGAGECPQAEAAPVQQPGEAAHGAVWGLPAHLLVVVVADADLPLRVYAPIDRHHDVVLLL
jgi:hypothetical protein